MNLADAGHSSGPNCDFASEAGRRDTLGSLSLSSTMKHDQSLATQVERQQRRTWTKFKDFISSLFSLQAAHSTFSDPVHKDTNRLLFNRESLPRSLGPASSAQFKNASGEFNVEKSVCLPVKSNGTLFPLIILLSIEFLSEIS